MSQPSQALSLKCSTDCSKQSQESLSVESHANQTRTKETRTGWFSSFVEAYSMSIYPFMAPFLAKRMFQDETGGTAVFFSYCLVLIGFCCFYPLGALYYGILGDKKGRRPICTSSCLGLALATGLMGLFPLETLGENAWSWFLILISLQHFFSGGEYHGSIVFSLEHTEGKRSGLNSAMSCFFAVCGILLANGLGTLSVLADEEIAIRSCFVIGAAGGVLSYFLNYGCRETPAYSALSGGPLGDIALLSFLKTRGAKIWGTVLMLALFMVSYSFIFIFLPLVYGFSFATFQALIAYGVLLVLGGYIADRIGILTTMEIGAFFFSVSLIPLCYFCTSLPILQILLAIFACLAIGPIHSWMVNQFEVQERCRGIFISSAIAMSLFGGSTVPICLLIYEQFQSILICALYPLAIGLTAFFYLATPEATKADIQPGNEGESPVPESLDFLSKSHF